MALELLPWPDSASVNLYEVFNVTLQTHTSGGVDNTNRKTLSEDRNTQLSFDEACMRLKPGFNYFFAGYRQSYRYFSSPETEAALRRMLAFREPAMRKFGSQWLHSALLRDSTTTKDNRVYFVGVHIRHEMNGHPITRPLFWKPFTNSLTIHI